MLESVTLALTRGENAQALAIAEAAVATHPHDADALHALAVAQRVNGDLGGAGATLDRALSVAPDRSELHVARAHLALSAEDIDAAIAGFARSIDLDPNQLVSYVMLGQVALATGDLEEAEKQLNLARRIAPDHPHVLLNEGGLAQARGDVDTAIRVLSRAVAAVPEDASVLGGLGVAYLSKGLFAFAAETLARALEKLPKARHLRWARVQALRQDGRHSELLADLEWLVAGDERDFGAQALLGDTLFALDRKPEALAAYRRLLERADGELPVVDAVLRALAARDAREDAVVLLEALIEEDPSRDLIWLARTDLEAGQPEAAAIVLSRWLRALPDSAQANEREALRLEETGELKAAEGHADTALAADPARSSAHLVKMRAELHRDPEAALKRLVLLAAGARRPEAHRMVLGWRGMALERLGRTGEALEAWREMDTHAIPRRPLPAVRPAGTPAAAVDGLAPLLLWGPPGAHAERVMLLLRGQQAYAMLDDRFGRGPRPDGFGPDLAPAVSAGASNGSGEASPPVPDVTRWSATLDRVGLDPQRVIDWLPHFDPAIDAALPGNRLVAVIRDPRDVLLDWWVFGNVQLYPFPGAEAAADWLVEALEPIAERIEQRGPEHTLLVRVEQAEDDPQALAQALAGFIGLDQAPGTDSLSDPRKGLGGHRSGFAGGHWKQYADDLGPVFARLEAVAARLGY